MKKIAIVSTASFGAPTFAPDSSPHARARKNRTHAAANGAPDAAARSWSHFSRFRYSLRAASAASSTANACGARSSTTLSAFRSWHTSSSRGTLTPPSRECTSAIARATHSAPAALALYTLCSTSAVFRCPPAERYGGSVAATTSLRNPPASAGSSAMATDAPRATTSPHAVIAGSITPLAAFASATDESASDASVRYKSTLSQHWFGVPIGDAPPASPSIGGIFLRENAHGNMSPGATIACRKNSSCPAGASVHPLPPATAATGNGSLSFVALANILTSASNVRASGTIKPRWFSLYIAFVQSNDGHVAASASAAFS